MSDFFIEEKLPLGLIPARESKILIIDDDHSILNLVKLAYKNQPVKIFCVDNAYEGLICFHQQDIDFCVLDINIETYNGLQLAKQFRKSNPKEIPIIFITGKNNGLKDYYMSDIFNSYFLPKPFQSKDILKITGKMAPHILNAA